MTTPDTLLAAARLTERRAWLRTAAAAPIPEPVPVYAPLRPADHDAAITAALAGGTTSLQQWKERQQMPKIKLQTPQATPDAPPASPRATCVVCQLFAPRALAGHAVCAACAADPAAARRHLANRRARALGQLAPAQAAFDAAYAALSAPELARWQAICQARLAVGRAGRWAGTADQATRDKLQRTKEAIDRGDPRVGEGLRAVWHADEGLFWANEVAADEGRRVDVAAAQYEAAVAALGQQQMEAA